MSLNNRVKALRKKMRMSQQELADELGILRTTLSKIENGHLNPSTKLMLKCEEIFHEPFGTIFFTNTVSSNDTGLGA